LSASRGAWILAGLAVLITLGRAAPGQTAKNAARATSELASETPSSMADPADLKDFEIACDNATGVASDLESALVELDFVRREKTPDRQKLAELEADVAKKSAQAFAYCQRAIELSDTKSNLEKLNLVRYMLSYFHYAKKQYYEAAVIGEFLARKYPDAAKARPAAQIALTSLDALYREHKQAGETDLTFESGKLTDLANYILKTWPDQPEAGPPAELLMQFELADGNFDRARETLARMPEDSRGRADAELRLGHALWTKYLRSVQELRQSKSGGEGNSQTVNLKDKPELASLAKQAQELLESGVKGRTMGRDDTH